jgi:hypothetical protein
MVKKKVEMDLREERYLEIEVAKLSSLLIDFHPRRQENL